MSKLPSPYFASGGRYIPNHESFGAMMVSEQVRKPLVAVAKLIAAQARVNTQRSAGGSSRLADAYEAEKGPLVTLIVDGKPSPRISQRVVNRLRHAAANEFGRGGYKKGRGTRDLRRAGQAFGDLSGEAG